MTSSQKTYSSTIGCEERVKVAIVDDEESARLFLQDLFERSREFKCVGSYASGEEAVLGVPAARPSIVLMDIRLPGMSGIDCMRRLKSVLPGLIVVLVTGLVDSETTSEALRAGGDNYLTKPFTVAQCLATLRFAIGRNFEGNRKAQARQQRQLIGREQVVMECIAEGLLNKEIAEKLHLSVPVVEKVARRIYAKLGVGNRVEAVGSWRLRA